MHLTEPSRLLSSSGCAEQLSINNRAFGERMFCKHWWRLTAGTNSSKPLGKNFWIHPHISLRLIDHRECIHVYVFKASWLRRFPQQISTTVQLVKEIAKFFNESTLGEQDSGWKESASKTNQEADDRLFWPMLLENQSRKRSTNGTIQEARKVAKNFQQQNIEVCTTTVWRYMTRKGWKAFTRKKIPLLSEKQRKARLRFAKKHAKLTAEDWDNFLFTDKCPKYLFHAVP